MSFPMIKVDYFTAVPYVCDVDIMKNVLKWWSKMNKYPQ